MESEARKRYKDLEAVRRILVTADLLCSERAAINQALDAQIEKLKTGQCHHSKDSSQTLSPEDEM